LRSATTTISGEGNAPPLEEEEGPADARESPPRSPTWFPASANPSAMVMESAASPRHSDQSGLTRFDASEEEEEEEDPWRDVPAGGGFSAAAAAKAAWE
jgi:hypothetical protein